MTIPNIQPIIPSQCLSYNTIVNNYNGSVIENQDGTVSVFVNTGSGLGPMVLTKPCCEYLKPSYVFDIKSQKCLWSAPATCDIQEAFKLVLNPKGNDGTLFYIEDGDNCSLSIDFDYLFKVKCETLANIINENQQTQLSPTELGVLVTLEEQLATQIAICQGLSIQISEYTDMLTGVSYSIVCESTPVVVENVSTKVKSIGESAFGKVGMLGSKSIPAHKIPPAPVNTPTISGQLYCLTEPDGLNQWSTILGSVNYNAFINGDQTSYTCGDVQTIFDLNNAIIANNIAQQTNTPVLLIECTTPVNTKTNLVNTITSLSNQLIACNETIISLQAQITLLDTSLILSAPCTTPLDFFESFDASMSIDVVTSANTLNTVFSGSLLTEIGAGNLYKYLVSHANSGFYVCGDPTGNETLPNCTPLILDLTGTTTNVFTCNNIVGNLIDGLYVEYSLTGTSLTDFENSISPNSFSSKWLHYHAVISDPNIIKQIANQKIKLSISINHTCGDFCVLVDEIVLDKVCTHVKTNSIFLTQSPGFELDRIRDNKKSWIANTTPTNRPFVITNNQGGSAIRRTNYDVNDERLVINTKEIDLDISLASAIETDIWCYVSANPCLLTGITHCNPCINECAKAFQDDECFYFQDGYLYEFMDEKITGTTSPFNFSECCGDNMIDFQSLMTQPLSAVTTIEDFEYFLTSELIDAKNRQTISGYPTLRALYDRYMNSGLYCGNISSSFDYMTMDKFAGLIGNYWVDIVEQVIPATTIWGSTKIYSNTLFDQQKFKYRAYSSLFCGNPYSGETILSPIRGIHGEGISASVATTSIGISASTQSNFVKPITTYCSTICIAQMNVGSEFIGGVTIQTG